MIRVHLVPTEELSLEAAGANTWSELYKRLGFSRTPPAHTRARVERLLSEREVDVSHLGRAGDGPSRTEGEVVDALAPGGTWREVSERLGVSVRVAKRLVSRYRVDATHIVSWSHLIPPADGSATAPEVDKSNLRVAAESIAKAWFEMRGFTVMMTEPESPVDLVVGVDDQNFRGVQVKSTNSLQRGRWAVNVSQLTEGSSTRKSYSPERVHEFFIVTGNGDMYRIPYEVVGSQKSIHISDRHAAYRVPPILGIASMYTTHQESFT